MRLLNILYVLIFLCVNSAAYAHEDQQDVLNPHALPLGDGKTSSSPQRGYVYSCRNNWQSGGGAQHTGEWIHGEHWDMTQKIMVEGDVEWPDAQFNMLTGNNDRKLTGNGLPLHHGTGVFPISRSDPAFEIDRNPNRIAEQNVEVSLPRNPQVAGSASCVGMGMIGITIDGVAFFNALDADGRDAVAHEVQDHCNGHPERSGRYHYHGPMSCVAAASANNTLIGYALDGFGIYSRYDENGKELTNADLDECHGRVSNINWDGKMTNMYHYVLTREYPYTVGCFRGSPVHLQTEEHGMPPRGERQPPVEAVEACHNHASEALCRFISPRGDDISGHCRSPMGNMMVCVPDHPPMR